MDHLFPNLALGALRRGGKNALWLAGRTAAAPSVALRAPFGAAAPYRLAGTINYKTGECYPCPRSRLLPMSPAVHLRSLTLGPSPLRGEGGPRERSRSNPARSSQLRSPLHASGEGARG